MDLRRGSQRAVEKILEVLEANKRVITTSAEIAQVATISANGDAHIGQLIANAMEKVGREGVITVKEGKTIEDTVRHPQPACSRPRVLTACVHQL
jgi:chaperonin GroEL